MKTKEVNAPTLPKPTSTYVLVANPLHGKEDTIRKELEKMPEKNRLDYMKEHLYNVWQDLEVLAIGEDVKGLAVGDRVITTPDLATQGIHIMDGSHMLIRSSNFIAKW